MKFYQYFYSVLTLSLGIRAAKVVDSTSNNVSFGIALEMLYTSFQNVMPCGYPPLNIPVLAPVSLDFLPYKLVNGNEASLLGNLSNTIIIGLNNFRLLAGNYNETSQRTSFDIIFSEIQILGEFATDAYINIGGYALYGMGTGLLNMKFIDLRLVGDFTLSASQYNSNSLRVSDFNFHFHFGNIIMNNWNDLWNIAANNFLNNWTQNFIMFWSEEIQAQVNLLYAQLLLPQINGYLENINMNQLIDIYVNLAQTFNMVQCTLK